MLRNYLKIAFRNLWKHRLFSVINIFGLASGLMVCLLALTHIRGAFTYDRFHPNYARTYRILTDVVGKNNDVIPYATSPAPLAQTLKRDYDFVEETARVVRTYGEVTGNQRHLSLLSFAVDAGFFRVFNYPLAQGEPAMRPGTAVISRETAERFFGTASPIGQVITQEGRSPAVVTGVLADTIILSHLRFDVLFSLENPAPQKASPMADDWKTYDNGYTYVLLRPQTTAERLKAILPAVSARALRGVSFRQEKGYQFRQQALADISPSRQERMYGTYEPQIGGLLVEMGVGLVTLLMAAFNYINLTLARSLGRAREVGIRKVAGALRRQILAQFMAESVVLSLLALALAALMLELIRPMAFVQRWLLGGIPHDATLWLTFIAFSLVAGLLAGFVPARVLSGFQPAQVLRSQTGLRMIRGISLRKALIVTQFVVSLVALIGLLTMSRQQYYMADGDYGFRRERVLNIPLNTLPLARLADELRRLPGVERVTATSERFGHHGDYYGPVKRRRGGPDSTGTFIWSVDEHMVSTLNLRLAAGRNLPPASADSPGHLVLLNEEAVRAFRLGSAREAVGQSLWLNDSTEVTVAGVLNDFRFTTFTWAMRPLILRNVPAQYRYLSVAVAEGAEQAVLADAQRIWKRLRPYEPFAGQWYDDFLHERHAHAEDINFMALLIGLAFSIACLGLFGMVTYTTRTRTKEVGIRKVMGAHVYQIMWTLSRGFVQLLLIAGAIALPLGYLGGYAILSNFAYHVSIGLETLVTCFGLLLLLGSLTICLQTYRAALMNPVESLRTE